ncbi:hypothetical protein E2C01_023589 [Portunus trituberculatus]|uniref:Uncharacterized protein n=1 Tax=Portunus trituberculatus TaxID=210409 RepID=A0A5B7E9G4_PORTR|nr:hypothetical protein [Portunus trituberculatus]
MKCTGVRRGVRREADVVCKKKKAGKGRMLLVGGKGDGKQKEEEEEKERMQEKDTVYTGRGCGAVGVSRE